ncbi:DUF6461 domain-containing protein [Nonomuraea sp. NPDC050328]|uniref:DUF6461 domain-containing protein n=1 Tax=Nonomuraea sp. NPDC050328 TaxID=3364361 RepID=UPI003799B7EE
MEGGLMSSATAAPYEWLYQEFTTDTTWLCVSFVRDLSPEAALQRISVTPGTLDDSGFGIGAYAARGGTALIEYGWGGIVYYRSDLLSGGTTSAAVFANINNDDFAYYVDGQLITTFGLHSYGYRRGASPDQFQSDLGDLGMRLDDEEPYFVDNPVSSALALAERVSGVHLPRAHYARDALIGAVGHLDPYR